MRPVIGVTCSFGKKSADSDAFIASVRSEYLDNLFSAGGLPLPIAPIEGEVEVESYLELVDGLLLSGGDDVDPALFGRAMHPETKLIHPRRLQFERRLTESALAGDVPILAICGGMQLLNVVCGGDLHQHIPDIADTLPHKLKPPDVAHHPVTIETDSLLFHTLGREEMTVNSYHHQAVRREGSGLRVVARAPDGIVEAIESARRRFVLGLQWHPERIIDAEHASLFATFVRICSHPDESARDLLQHFD